MSRTALLDKITNLRDKIATNPNHPAVRGLYHRIEELVLYGLERELIEPREAAML